MLFAAACAEPEASPSVAVPSEAATTQRPQVDSATATPTTEGRAAIAPEALADVVIEAGAQWSRYSDGEKESLPLRYSPLGTWQLLDGGDIVYQRDYNKPVMVLRVGETQPEVFIERPAEAGRHVTLVGRGRIDGRAVALVADGTATALNSDEGTAIVAVDAANGDRAVLIDDAANAWEGGVSLASVEGRWLVYHSTSLTTGAIIAVDRATQTRRKLRDADHDSDAVDFQGLELLPGADAPTAVLLTRHRTGYPKDPTAELQFLSLDGSRTAKPLAVPGISWQEGLPWSLSATDAFLVVNRQEEQAGPAAALAYGIDEDKWYELPRPTVIAMR